MPRAAQRPCMLPVAAALSACGLRTSGRPRRHCRSAPPTMVRHRRGRGQAACVRQPLAQERRPGARSRCPPTGLPRRADDGGGDAAVASGRYQCRRRRCVMNKIGLVGGFKWLIVPPPPEAPPEAIGLESYILN
jgi:hypothetical protein